MRAIMILIGIILLLPGLCSLGFMVAFLPQLGGDLTSAGMLGAIWLVCLAISFGGIMLIRGTLRSMRPSPRP
jgi:hypothetical protein